MERLIAIYYLVCKPHHLELLQKPISKKNVNEILRCCVKSEHQYCISNEAIDDVVSELSRDGILDKKFIDFEDLYDHVRMLLKPISGIGDLTIYDTALRIGYMQNVLPQQYVYLAAGPLMAAKKLFPGRSFKFREPIQTFYPLFGNMKSWDIEDFLCVMKRYFTAGGVNVTRVNSLVATLFPVNDVQKLYKACCKSLYVDKTMRVLKPEFLDDGTTIE